MLEAVGFSIKSDGTSYLELWRTGTFQIKHDGWKSDSVVTDNEKHYVTGTTL
jgi:hypothetical protein